MIKLRIYRQKCDFTDKRFLFIGGGGCDKAENLPTEV